MITWSVHMYARVTFPLLDTVQDVVATLFNECEELSRAPAMPYHMAIQLIRAGEKT